MKAYRVFSLPVAFLSLLIAAPTAAQDPTDGLVLQTLQILREAGYENSAPSLTQALYASDPMVAAIAAGRLAQFPASPTTVSALHSATEHPNEVLAFTAMQTLHTLGVTAWQDRAVERLEALEDPSVRLEIAGLLARSGRTEGWPAVRDVLRGNKRALFAIAVSSAVPFHGLKDTAGGTIDALVEIRSVQARVGTDVGKSLRARIDRGVAELSRGGPQPNPPRK